MTDLPARAPFPWGGMACLVVLVVFGVVLWAMFWGPWVPGGHGSGGHVFNSDSGSHQSFITTSVGYDHLHFDWSASNYTALNVSIESCGLGPCFTEVVGYSYGTSGSFGIEREAVDPSLGSVTISVVMTHGDEVNVQWTW